MSNTPTSQREKTQRIRRADSELPYVSRTLGWRFHHLGIPTDKKKEGEVYLEAFKMYVSGFKTSPFGIEWMRFEPNSPVSEIIQKVPHLAFEVDNLEEAVEGKTLIGEISSPSKGVRVAMFLDNGAPVEVMEFEK